MTETPHRRHSRKRSFGKTVKVYGGVTLACFLIGAGLFFLSERGPQMLQEKIGGTMISQAERMLGRKMTDRDAALIQKRFGININPSGSGGGQGGGNAGNLNSSQTEASHGGDSSVGGEPGQGKVFKERELLEMVDRYAGGKVDPAEIEKAKRALREQR